ncbi:MAG: MBL fold metallo-hydrolase [Microbacterium sp.]|uniref:MBL fold metallo-hydrolase n=1 Tax=Microbacterium sp. TaxID=51671 RepID=UPI00271AF2A9|nr:MBL fold metallo-hydrolase [Microbacterium sp.]MDO8383863.1 MBL fold metallo-hydrolase [Microbacterium sp.]
MSVVPNHGQFEAWASHHLPDTVQVQQGVWAVPLPLAGDQYVRHTYTYLVVDEAGSVHVIDPGWDTADNRSRLATSLGQIGKRLSDVRTVVSTHRHPDHTGLAPWIREVSGAPLLMHSAEAEAAKWEASVSMAFGFVRRLRSWGASWPDRAKLSRQLWRERRLGDAVGVRADAAVEHDEVLDIPGWRLRVVHTPGHTEGSICLYDETTRSLFSGDTLLPMVHPGIGLSGAAPSSANPLRRYLGSLASLARLDVDMVHPGHGYSFTGLNERLDETIGHHRRRSEEVRSILASQPGISVWQVAERVHWTAGWANLSGYMRLSAVAQTVMHIDYLRGESADEGSTRN